MFNRKTPTEPIRQHDALACFFKGTNHVDIKTIEGPTDLRTFIAGMLSYYPWWMALLFRSRAVLVSLLGLVEHEIPKTPPAFKAQDIPFQPGQNAMLFTVRAAKENTYWVAESPKDKHLKAYLGIVAEKQNDQQTRYHVFTTVIYLHWTGPLYFNLIRPFHHLVVARMIKAGVRAA